MGKGDETPTSLTFTNAINELFDTAQRTSASHKKTLSQLKDMYTESKDAFTDGLIEAINNLLGSNVQDAAVPGTVQRIINLLSQLIVGITEMEAADQKGDFAKFILNHLCNMYIYMALNQLPCIDWKKKRLK